MRSPPGTLSRTARESACAGRGSVEASGHAARRPPLVTGSGMSRACGGGGRGWARARSRSASGRRGPGARRPGPSAATTAPAGTARRPRAGGGRGWAAAWARQGRAAGTCPTPAARPARGPPPRGPATGRWRRRPRHRCAGCSGSAPTPTTRIGYGRWPACPACVASRRRGTPGGSGSSRRSRWPCPPSPWGSGTGASCSTRSVAGRDRRSRLVAACGRVVGSGSPPDDLAGSGCRLGATHCDQTGLPVA